MIIFLTLDTLLLNFPRCVSIFLLQTSKTDNNALDIDGIYNLKLFLIKKKSVTSTRSGYFLTTIDETIK
jgi:hypothetical protein